MAVLYLESPYSVAVLYLESPPSVAVLYLESCVVSWAGFATCSVLHGR